MEVPLHGTPAYANTVIVWESGGIGLAFVEVFGLAFVYLKVSMA